MGFSLLAYLLLAVTGVWSWQMRHTRQTRPDWLRTGHYWIGIVLVVLVLLLLAIGLVGTLGHYGSLGHSWHLPAGLLVVVLVSLSAWSANQIGPQQPWARPLHLSLNALLFAGLVWVSVTGWTVVQKYLP